MGNQRVYPVELRQRAARMVLEWRRERGRQDGGIKEVAEQLGVHPESVRNWVHHYSADAGCERAGRALDEVALEFMHRGDAVRVAVGARA